MLVDTMLRGNLRALLLIEDDTCPPPHAILTFDRWFWKMERKLAPPVVSGLYHIKGSAEVRNGKKGGVELLGILAELQNGVCLARAELAAQKHFAQTLL